MAKRYHSIPNGMNPTKGKFGSAGEASGNDKNYSDMGENESAFQRNGAQMMSNDPMAFANMPPQVHMKPYPKRSGYEAEGRIGDDIHSMDSQMTSESSQARKFTKPRKA